MSLFSTSQPGSHLHAVLAQCPTCAGTGTIAPAAPVPLTPMQFKIWDAVRRSREGLTAPEIAAQVYADRYDGGPLHAKTCIYLTIRAANRRLQAAHVAIVSTTQHRGGAYRVRAIGG
jgi:hypothetical protein